MLRDVIDMADTLILRARDRLGGIIAGRELRSPERSVVEVRGWVQTCLRERGKIVPYSRRERHNVWTVTGREYMAQISSPSFARNDRIAYVGVGTGMQAAETSVIRLAQPVPYVTGVFLAPLGEPTYPLKNTARYHRVFTSSELTFGGTTTMAVSEFGLFTNGCQENNFSLSPPRDTSIAGAGNQSPFAYASDEPFPKTDRTELEITWELYF
jgi:hypothetical protein